MRNAILYCFSHSTFNREIEIFATRVFSLRMQWKIQKKTEPVHCTVFRISCSFHFSDHINEHFKYSLKSQTTTTQDVNNTCPFKRISCSWSSSTRSFSRSFGRTFGLFAMRCFIRMYCFHNFWYLQINIKRFHINKCATHQYTISINWHTIYFMAIHQLHCHETIIDVLCKLTWHHRHNWAGLVECQNEWFWGTL